LAFFVYICVLLRFLKSSGNNIAFIWLNFLIFILNFQRFLVLPALGLNSKTLVVNTCENIVYFSSDDDDDGSKTPRPYSPEENNEDDSNTPRPYSPEETPALKRRKLNHEDDEEDNSNNSNNDSDSDDLENADVTEVDDHNAPEKIIDDLDTIDKARKGDPDALDEIKQEYPEFFKENSDEEGLDQVEEYLEEEFEGEYERSELEADALEQNDEGDNSAGGTGPSGSSGSDPGPSGSSGSSGSDPGPSNSSGSSGSGPGPSGSSGSSGSDPGPSNSSGGGGDFSKILIILGVIFETIAKVLEDLSNFL
jgi:hypothetical protein